MLFLPCNSAWRDQLAAYNGQAITVDDVASLMFPLASPYISAGANATSTLVDNLIDDDNSHKVPGEIVSETITLAVIGFLMDYLLVLSE